MSAEVKAEVELEIAHILFIDTVGYSTLLMDEQRQVLADLNSIVRSSSCFRTAESARTLIRLPTGDGMALVFLQDPESPVRCALEISKAAQGHAGLPLRMGIHSGPISRVVDVNDRTNIAGAGINTAQRVMNCGDAGHILLSKRAAGDLAQYHHWHAHLHDLGECEVKHGVKLGLVNLYTEDLGNSALPSCLKRAIDDRSALEAARRETSKRNLLLAIAAALALAGVAIAGYVVLYRNGETVRSVNAKSIAVLPFQNLSEEKENAFFADAVQDEILTDLAKVADLKVISRTSVMQFKSQAQRNLREIARELGVAHILEGTVQRAGGRVRVNVQLIDARTDTHVWAQRYDGDPADVFALESEVAEKIVSQLRSKLSPAEKAAIEERPTSDFAAYDLYTRAKTILSTAAFNVREKEKLFEAAQLLEQATTRDPEFFLAYYQLARTHDRIYILGIDHSSTRIALADAAIDSLRRLKPDSGEAHLALAAHVYSVYLDYDQARAELAIAGRALPNEPLVFELTGYIDRRQGRWDECVSQLKRALELDPHNFFTLQQISLACRYMRRFPEATASLDQALKLIPTDAGTRVERGLADLEWRADAEPLHRTVQTVLSENPNVAGGVAQACLYLALCERDHQAATRALTAMTGDGCRLEGIPFPHAWCEAVAARAKGDNATADAALLDARAEIERIVLTQPNYAEALCVIGMIDAGLGRKAEAIREGRRAVELLPVTKDSINGALLVEYLAVIYAWTGDKDLALEQLTRAAQIPSDVSYGQLRLHPYWDSLRGDPRFDGIVASVAPK